MWVRYIIPEDGDNLQHPNVFQLDKNGEVRFADIQKAFPIPGQFHFRFLKTFGNVAVWLDIMNDNETIPLFQGNIVMKASRVPSKESFVPSEAPVPSRVAQQTVSATPSNPNLINIVDDSAFQSSSKPEVANNSNAFGDNDNDLLGFNSSSTSSAAPKPLTADLFGLDTLQPSAVPLNRPMSGGMSAQAPMGSNRYPSPAPPMGGMGGTPPPMQQGMGAFGHSAPTSSKISNLNMNQPRPNVPGKPMGGGGYDPFDSLNNGGGGQFPRGGVPAKRY